MTRNADIDADALYEEDIDYREFMAELIKRRKRLAPVRLELSRELDGEIVRALCKHMDVNKDHVFRNNSPLDLSFLFGIEDILRQKTELFYGRRIPQRSASLAPDRPVLDQIREGDKLLSYPYESMKPFLEMLQQAANDENVVSIKMTLYRVAKQSKVVEALIEAEESRSQKGVFSFSASSSTRSLNLSHESSRFMKMFFASIVIRILSSPSGRPMRRPRCIRSDYT